jgi:hypothetical protein
VNQSLTTIYKGSTNDFSLVTILAFAFIPLSLATSFFGMNIQELNSTGQPMWIFLVTSVGILLVALTIWAIFYQWTKFIHAPEYSANHRYMTPEAVGGMTRWTRAKSFLWLIYRGHFIWCWRSGILFALLTNGHKGFTVTCDGSACGCPVEVPAPKAGYGTLSTHHQYNAVTYIQAHSKWRHLETLGFSANSVEREWNTTI